MPREGWRPSSEQRRAQPHPVSALLVPLHPPLSLPTPVPSFRFSYEAETKDSDPG